LTLGSPALSLEEKVQDLADREMIRDCLYRYCRGIDRADETALRSAYWPDATDHHGAYQGGAEGFIAWALETLPTIERGVHQIHNVLIEFREGGAAVETYFTALQRQRDPDGLMQQWHMAGRYVDWFEKRQGAWRVARRVVVFDWVEPMALPQGSEAERFGRRQPIGGLCPDDPVYALLRSARGQ
jgi:hypothetical protein